MHRTSYSPEHHPQPDSLEAFLQQDDFLEQAEEIIFTKQQPDFHNAAYTQEVLSFTHKKRVREALTRYRLNTIYTSYHDFKEAYLDPIANIYTSCRSALVKKSRTTVGSSILELPDLVIHPDAGEKLIAGVDAYTPEKLQALKQQLPHVTVKQETYTDESGDEYTAFTDQQIYEIYNVLARYAERITEERIEIRPAKQRIFGKKTQNTMRTVSIPVEQHESPEFKGKRDMLKRALKGLSCPHERLEVTRFNTSNEKNIASVGNLNELGCSLAGIYGHEAPHVRQGMERNNKQKRAFTKTYLLNKEWRSELEKINDAESVLMGHGLDLYTFKMIVDANSQPQFVSKKFDEYMVPKQILRLIFYVEKSYRNRYDQAEDKTGLTRGYFAPEIVEQARQLRKTEDRKDIDKYKFPENKPTPSA